MSDKQVDNNDDQSGTVLLESLKKGYVEADATMWAVNGIDLKVAQSEFVSLTGPSGSGKSTLLNLIAGLDDPTEGRVLVDGADIANLGGRARAKLRRERVTFVFQFFNLLSSLTAAQNVAVPLRAGGHAISEINDRVAEALRSVGLPDRGGRYPDQLSGGELQRVAIARALATGAPIVLADEPTGNLDQYNGEQVLELLKQASEENGRTVILVTHDPRAAGYGDRTIGLRDGRIEFETDEPDLSNVVALRPADGRRSGE
jgi:putative ABC transport system ATP-binding protein